MANTTLPPTGTAFNPALSAFWDTGVGALSRGESPFLNWSDLVRSSGTHGAEFPYKAVTEVVDVAGACDNRSAT